MASPIGHLLAGYTIYSSIGRRVPKGRSSMIWMCMFMAIAPDLDFIPGLVLGQPALYHQGISHSFGCALTVSLALAWLYGHGGRAFVGTCVALFLSYSSHLAIDFFAPDGRVPYGQPLLWPIEHSHYISPFAIFWGFHHAGSASSSTFQWVTSIFSLHNLGAIAVELAIMSPIIVLTRRLKNHWERVLLQ